MIVTIDGPAGSGKSSTARRVASQLDYVYLDTGAMYRAVALAFLRADVLPVTSERADGLLHQVEVDVRYQSDVMKVILNGDEVTRQIRTADVGNVVSQISTLEPVRDYMVQEQRRIGREQEEKYGGVVLDGRDTGTVVFPDAPVKIYMVADLDERARRRQQQYAESGEEISFEEVRNELEERDHRDQNREIAPLRRADDAVVLDTTDRTIAEQVAFVVDRVKAHPAWGT